MLIYQPTEVLKSVMYHYNALTTNKNTGGKKTKYITRRVSTSGGKYTYSQTHMDSDTFDISHSISLFAIVYRKW